jgi:DNA-binding MarR family transcriptional regulator
MTIGFSLNNMAKSRTTIKSGSRSKQSLRTWLRLLSCETRIEQHLRKQFRMHCPVTLPQFDVLSELERAGTPLTMSQLSIELMVSNGNITGVVDRLEKAGFVKRNRPPHDRRIQFIELTTTGTKEFRRMAQRHEKWLADLFCDLSPSDMNQLQILLLKARNSVTTSAAA